jgi:hypothetical protein
MDLNGCSHETGGMNDCTTAGGNWRLTLTSHLPTQMSRGYERLPLPDDGSRNAEDRSRRFLPQLETDRRDLPLL